MQVQVGDSVIIQIIDKLRMRRQKQVNLSTFISDKQQIPNKKISLPGKSITNIDELNPYTSSEVESLILQNNRLSSLKGIEQFTFLKELDISENKIQSCQELNRLKELYQLKKLYLSNNPFLNEPISEDILDFILDKETDIEILSFEILSTLKDVEEKEIKIIFLKNYIQKIDLHQELKSKKRVSQPRKPIQTEELLSKIVPQFYTLIQDPKLINKIKKEAIDIKKQSQESMEEALETTKLNKDEKIDQLIKDIVSILHQNDDFHKSRSFLLQVNLSDNTISFSPQRKRQVIENNLQIESQEYSPVKYIEMSKDDASIEDITLTNTKHFATTNIKRFQPVINDNTLPNFNSKTISSPKNDLDNLETARKDSTIKSISEKLKQHTEFKQTYQSQIKKMKERQSSQGKHNSSENSEMKESITTPIQATPIGKHFDMSKFRKASTSMMTSNYIKVIEENQEESQQNKSSLLEKQAKQAKQVNNPHENTFKTQKIQSSNISYGSSMAIFEHMAPETVETIYFKSLGKINPMFSLLHSHSKSLNNEEKTQLLQALKVDHKDKFIELVKERQSNQYLMRELQQARLDHTREMENTVSNNKNVYNQYLVYKEQFQWIDHRQRATQQKCDQLAIMYREVEANDKKKAIALNILENNYKKLKHAYGQMNARNILLENADEKEEIIRQKRQDRINNKYLKELSKRAKIWSEVLKKSVKNRKIQEKKLIVWGMQSFIFNRYQSKALSEQIKRSQMNLQREHLNEWKTYTQISKKEKALSKQIFKKNGTQFMELLKKNEANNKLMKLKGIWAARFFTDKSYKSSIKAWKLLKQNADNNQQKSSAHSKAKTSRKIFNALRSIVLLRKSYIEDIEQRRTNRLKQSQFKRMIFIMKKEALQIDEKYRKTMKNLQKLQRYTYFKDFQSHIQDRKGMKDRKSRLKKYLTLKNYLSFIKIQKSTFKRLNRLSTFCRNISFGVSLKMLKRQKHTNDYSERLLRRRWKQFFKNLRENGYKQSHFKKNEQKIKLLAQSKLNFLKLKFIKRLQVLKLKGKNYIKNRKLKQMNRQMDLNDQNTIDLIRAQKEEITRCEKEIIFLKTQIQGLSMREMALLHEKDEMLLSINQSYEIMMQLRRQVDSIRQDSLQQQQKYNSLVLLYNQSVAILQKKEKEYERLYETLRQHKIK